jgi:hypothetical protein
LKVLENGMLRRVFGTKKEDVAGGWGRRHNGGFKIVIPVNYYQHVRIRKVEMGRACCTNRTQRKPTKFS